MANPTFSFTSPRPRYFSLPFYVISYITERCSSYSALEYQKFQQTCKYFFAKKKIIILDIDVCNHFGEFNYCLYRDRERYFQPNIQYWLTNGLFIAYPYKFVLNNIYRYDLEELLLRDVILSYNDIDFLITNKKPLKNVGWYNVTITDNDSNNPFTIIDLLSKLPYITEFHYKNEKEIWTNEIFQKLNSMNFNEKFYKFLVHIFKFDDEMDPSLLCNFIKKNAASYAQIHFYDVNSEDGYPKLEAAVQKMLQEWPNENQKPRISFSHFY